MNEYKPDILGAFARIEWLLHKYYCHQRSSCGMMGDPHRGQGRVLSLLKIQPEITQKELTYLLDMRPQSLGELLTKLEQNGYIIRTTSETDRRRINIKLTDIGHEAANKGEQRSETFNEIFDCLNEEEQGSFTEYLKRIIDSLEDKMGIDKDDSIACGDNQDYNRLHHHNHHHRHFHNHHHNHDKFFEAFRCKAEIDKKKESEDI